MLHIRGNRNKLVLIIPLDLLCPHRLSQKLKIYKEFIHILIG
ncbi:hypothetical protein NOC27_2309 [Nitrosococcus oceani AFC27]|nr:hypothetical protein NOC27_2309 [Nitrosococcus oceani AFC27]